MRTPRQHVAEHHLATATTTAADLAAPFGFCHAYAPTEASVPRVRHELSGAMARAKFPSSMIDDAATCLSEMAGNAVVHAAAAGTYYVLARIVGHAQPRLHVAVIDYFPRIVVFPPPNTYPGNLHDLGSFDLEATSGRGLHMIAATASRYGCAPFADGRGKIVWCEIDPPQDNGPHQVHPLMRAVAVPA